MRWSHTSTRHVMPENIIFLFFQIIFYNIACNQSTHYQGVPCSVLKIIVLLKSIFIFLLIFLFFLNYFYNITQRIYLTHNNKFIPFAKNDNYLRLDLIPDYQVTRGVKFNPQQNNNISKRPSSELSSLLIILSHIFFLVFIFSYTDLKTTGHV